MVDLRDEENFELSSEAAAPESNRFSPPCSWFPALSSHTAMLHTNPKEDWSIYPRVCASVQTEFTQRGKHCPEEEAVAEMVHDKCCSQCLLHPVAPLGLHGSRSALLITDIPVVITKMSKSTFA